MVMHSLGDDGKYLSEEWHEQRRLAHETTVKIDEWSEIDQVRYDLDTVDFDRKKLDRVFILQPRRQSEGSAQGGTDIRELPTIRD